MPLRIPEFPVAREFPRLKLFPPISRKTGISREFPTHGFPLNIPAIAVPTFKMPVGFYQPTFKCCWTTCSVMVVKADRCPSLSMTKRGKGALSIETKINGQIYTQASYATYVSNQIILHATAGITYGKSVVVKIGVVVDVVELTNAVASTNSKLN